MYRVGVVLLPGVYLSSMGGLIDVFQIANAHIRNRQGEGAPQFQCETITQTDQPVVASGTVRLQADTTIDRAQEYDLIYVPGFFYSGISAFEVLANQHKPLQQWLVSRWQRGTAIATNCTGTFMVAETGMLDGREATTTWWLERQFRVRYPRVKLNAKALLTEDERLFCSGAMTAYLNMAVQFIERHAGPELAAQCAKIMLIDTSEKAQTPYQDLLSGDPSADPVVARAQYWLQTHLRDSVDQAALAEKMEVSQRTLIRRFKAELGVPPLTYLQNLRIETAKQLLENTGLPLAEVIEQVGYTDLSSFSRLFKQRIGITPTAYRQRFRAA